MLIPEVNWLEISDVAQGIWFKTPFYPPPPPRTGKNSTGV